MKNQRGSPGGRAREGELYRVIVLEGATFELYYGYYEDKDRENPLCEPIPIYPDFLKSPKYTDEGFPFVTDMQDACEYFKGKDPNDGCYGCKNYRRGEEFLGVCLSESRRKNE